MSLAAAFAAVLPPPLCSLRLLRHFAATLCCDTAAFHHGSAVADRSGKGRQHAACNKLLEHITEALLAVTVGARPLLPPMDHAMPWRLSLMVMPLGTRDQHHCQA